MDPQDLKRLVAGFLAFSLMTGTAVLVSLNFIGSPSQQQTIQAEGSNPLTTVSKNAFVEKLPEIRPQLTSSQQQSGGDTNDSSNLTQNFAGVFAKQMLSNNQGGPQTDQNGDPTILNMPDEDKAAEMIKQALSDTGAVFDESAAVPENKILRSFSQNDVSSYLQGVYDVLTRISSSTAFSSASTTTPTIDDITAPALAIDAAFDKLSSLSVPGPLAGVHKSLLGFFRNQKNVFNAVINYQGDPVKTMLAVQNEQGIISRDITRMKDAISNVDIKVLSLDNRSQLEKLYSATIGTEKAYATIPTWDYGNFFGNLTNTFATIGQMISDNLGRIGEWVYTTALRIAVNVLIDQFQNQVLNWIAGNGNPKFITDWKGFMQDVANKAIGQAIYGIAPQLCSGLGPLIRVSLLPVQYANSNIRCTLNQVIGNVNNFFNRFRNGGWYAYSYAMQPNNNYYGNLIVVNDQALIKADEAKNAATNKATASKGFLDITKCTKYVRDEFGNDTTTCEPGYEITTTPGAVVGETLTTSLGWKGNQIVSARRFEDLVSAIVNASINRIIKEGLSSLTAAMNPPPPSQASATPAGVSDPGGLSAVKNNVANLINTLERNGVWTQNQNIINADTQWLSLASSTMVQLDQLSNVCSKYSADAAQRKADILSMIPGVQTELSSAIAINDVNAMKAQAANATSSQNISGLLNQLQSMDPHSISDQATNAQARLASLQFFASIVNDDINGWTAGGMMPVLTCIRDLPTVTSTPQ